MQHGVPQAGSVQACGGSPPSRGTVGMLASQVVVLSVGMSMACPCEGLLVWMEVVAWLFAAGRIDLSLGALGLLLVMVVELVGAGDGCRCRGRARWVGWVVSQLGAMGC